MSETLTHPEPDGRNPITGDARGITEILTRRTIAEQTRDREPPPPPPTDRPADHTPPAAAPAEDDATRTATELANWRQRSRDAELRIAEADRARQAAETARAAAETRAAEVQQGAEDTGFTAITTALGAAQGETTSLRAELKAAGESGDWERMADINVRLGELGAEIRDLQRGKNEFERSREQRLRAPPPAAPPPPPATTLIGTPTERSILQRLGAQSREAFLATRTAATADFLRDNPQFFTDEAAFARISGADSLASGRGIAKDTPAYFDLIRKEAGMTQPASSPTHRPTDRPAEERTPTPGAAPSRDAPAPGGQRTTRSGDVYVTAEQKEAAAWLGVDPADYAAEEANLRARGEIPYRRR